jgi:outer membrane protein assembly factor BamB
MLIRKVAILGALLVSAEAFADDWEPLTSVDGHQYEIDAATVQRSQRADTKAPVIGIWIRNDVGNKAQVWVDCAVRWSATYDPQYGWTAWAPTPPESASWAVFEYLCRKKARAVNQH